jgi:hypothetical protein
LVNFRRNQQYNSTCSLSSFRLVSYQHSNSACYHSFFLRLTPDVKLTPPPHPNREVWKRASHQFKFHVSQPSAINGTSHGGDSRKIKSLKSPHSFLVWSNYNGVACSSHRSPIYVSCFPAFSNQWHVTRWR